MPQLGQAKYMTMTRVACQIHGDAAGSFRLP
jgi:hypothetical protein